MILGNFPTFLSGCLLATSLTVVSSVPLLTLKASFSKRNVRETEGRLTDRRHRKRPEEDGEEEGSVHLCVCYHGVMPHRHLVRGSAEALGCSVIFSTVSAAETSLSS